MHKSILPVKLVGLAGSLRVQSFSRATLVGLRDNLPDKVSLDILSLSLPSTMKTRMETQRRHRLRISDKRSGAATASSSSRPNTTMAFPAC